MTCVNPVFSFHVHAPDETTVFGFSEHLELAENEPTSCARASGSDLRHDREPPGPRALSRRAA